MKSTSVWLLSLAIIAYEADILLTPSASADLPPVTVEEGGEIVLKCANSSSIAACWIVPAPVSATFMVDGKGRYGEAAGVNATHCRCKLPPADAEATVFISFHDRAGDGPPQRATKAGNVAYVALWTPSVARRPYLSTDERAEVVLGLHAALQGAAVRVLLLPSREPLCDWTPVAPGAATTVPFSLATVPAVAEVQVAAQLRRGGAKTRGRAGVLERNLFLSRVSSPPAGWGTFVQVDYSRKTMLVNGELFVGSGYYDSQTVGPSNLSRQATAGMTWNMRYLTSNDIYAKYDRMPDSFVQSYLDWAKESDILVMLDLHTEFELLAGPPAGNTDPDVLIDDPWSVIERTVLRFRDHPALLGWYICDDCMTQWLIRQIQHKTPTLDTWYKRLKHLDPYHPAIGAHESWNMYTFSGANQWIPGPSLDVHMFENYMPSLADNAHLSTAYDYGADSGLQVWPLTWEPVVNCPGPFRVAWERKDISDNEKALIMYSFGWLSAILASAPHQLHFRLFPFEPTWGSPERDPKNPVFDKMMLQVGRFGRVAGSLSDFLFPVPTGRVEPVLEVQQGRAALEREPQQQCARIWRRALTGAPDAFCAMVAVVNTLNATVERSFRLRGADPWPGAANVRLLRVDADDAHGREEGDAEFSDGLLSLALAPSETQVYVTAACGPQAG